MPTRACDHCGNDYTRPPSVLGRYCSARCSGAALRKAPDELAGYGYRLVKAPNHPLAGATGLLHEHRIVLWEKLGEGPHPCHHCGREINWWPGSGMRADKLVVDHLNGDPRDNNPKNLVASCHACNLLNFESRVARTELFVVDHNSARHRISQGTCKTCETTFLRYDAGGKPPSPFCSRSCARGRTPN